MHSKRKSPAGGNHRARKNKTRTTVLYSRLASKVNIFLCRLCLKRAERAVNRPYNPAASLRIDRALLALESAEEAGV